MTILQLVSPLFSAAGAGLRWSVLTGEQKAGGDGGLAVARRRGAGQSAARVPMRAAKTRKPTAACGFGSRLPQNSPALIYARVPFVSATSGAARPGLLQWREEKEAQSGHVPGQRELPMPAEAVKGQEGQ